MRKLQANACLPRENLKLFCGRKKNGTGSFRRVLILGQQEGCNSMVIPRCGNANNFFRKVAPLSKTQGVSTNRAIRPDFSSRRSTSLVRFSSRWIRIAIQAQPVASGRRDFLDLGAMRYSPKEPRNLNRPCWSIAHWARLAACYQCLSLQIMGIAARQPWQQAASGTLLLENWEDFGAAARHGR
jgi:hypothetical protein